MSAQPEAAQDLLKIGELAEASGVPSATIRHYVREGLLPEPVKTSRNMAYYPAEFVDRIKIIKQLQEERFMPLKVIREVLASSDGDPERLRALVAVEDRILERALAGEQDRVSATEVRRRYDVPKEVLDRLAELGVLSPGKRGLLAIRRPHRRGDQPLPGRGLRRADRLHGLRHPALQERARGDRGGGGKGRSPSASATSTPSRPSR